MSDKAPVEVQQKTTVTVTTTVSRPENWRTLAIVGATVGAFCLIAIHWAFDRRHAIIIDIYLLIEGWTLVNKPANDTLSEGFWFFARHTVFIMICCLIVGVRVGLGIFGDPRTIVRGMMLGGLIVHFFWILKGNQMFERRS
jgi:hypothetical protein